MGHGHGGQREIAAGKSFHCGVAQVFSDDAAAPSPRFFDSPKKRAVAAKYARWGLSDQKQDARTAFQDEIDQQREASVPLPRRRLAVPLGTATDYVGPSITVATDPIGE
ncbi:MAG: hypothetical protein BroJett021_34330 [Chloroflexota bacterium]|nr:MAG: hypothetical protein BroJett021_34330 [Chloroflexota bacterium]